MSTETAADDVVEIRVEAYDKIDYWRDKLDQTPKLKKRDVYERAAADLFLEAQYERDLGAVQAIHDAVYCLGRDHAGLDDDSIQFVMGGAKAKAERPRRKVSRPAPGKPTAAQNSLREFGDRLPGDEPDDACTDSTNINPPPPVTSPEELRYSANEEIKKPAILRPTPFKYRPAIEIPKRAWLYSRHYLRGCATATIAPPGFNKSCRSLTELIIMALDRPLLGETPTAEGPLRCWYWSGEDELEEIERRIAAICDHHKLDGRFRSKLAECESIIQQLVTKLEETVGENDRLREENARLRSSENNAHAVLREVYNDPTASPAVRVKAAGLALPHEVPRLTPQPAPLDLPYEEVEPLAQVVDRQRKRADAMEREMRDIQVLPSGLVRILPKPGSNGGDDHWSWRSVSAQRRHM
jgi:hypothetical protein